MRRVRAWLRAFGPVRLLEDCAALVILEHGAEAEDDLRRAIEARPPLVQRIALGFVLRAVRRQQAEAIAQPVPVSPSPLVADSPPPEALRRIA